MCCWRAWQPIVFGVHKLQGCCQGSCGYFLPCLHVPFAWLTFPHPQALDEYECVLSQGGCCVSAENVL